MGRRWGTAVDLCAHGEENTDSRFLSEGMSSQPSLGDSSASHLWLFNLVLLTPTISNNVDSSRTKAQQITTAEKLKFPRTAVKASKEHGQQKSQSGQGSAVCSEVLGLGPPRRNDTLHLHSGEHIAGVLSIKSGADIPIDKTSSILTLGGKVGDTKLLSLFISPPYHQVHPHSSAAVIEKPQHDRKCYPLY